MNPLPVRRLTRPVTGGVARFDLLQVHNLLGWRGHLETLKEMKARGEIRYLGITTSHGRRHDDLARIMNTEPLDFVQLTYNVLDREAESTLLGLARDRGIAVIVNRPFQEARCFGGCSRNLCHPGRRKLESAAGRSFS